MPLVSVIIPVYNGEKYIAKCVESLLCQTLQNIEIILVNDGSNDNTLSIISQYASQDNRIKVVDKVNEGVSVARNIALSIAEGEWIAFSDADDFYYPDGLENLYKCAINTNTDVVLGNAERIKMDGTITLRYPHVSKISVHREFPKGSLEMWGDLFHHSIFHSDCNKFQEGLAYLEDRLLMLKILSKSKEYSIVPKPVYGHVKNEDSVLACGNGLRMAKHCFWASKMMLDYATQTSHYHKEIIKDSYNARLRAIDYFYQNKNAAMKELSEVYSSYFTPPSGLYVLIIKMSFRKLLHGIKKIVKKCLLRK